MNFIYHSICVTICDEFDRHISSLGVVLDITAASPLFTAKAFLCIVAGSDRTLRHLYDISLFFNTHSNLFKTVLVSVTSTKCTATVWFE